MPVQGQETCQESGQDGCCSESLLFVLIPVWLDPRTSVSNSAFSPSSPSQQSTTSCLRGRFPGGPTLTFHQPPKWCPSKLSPPRALPIRVSAARATETAAAVLLQLQRRDRFWFWLSAVMKRWTSEGWMDGLDVWCFRRVIIRTDLPSPGLGLGLGSTLDSRKQLLKDWTAILCPSSKTVDDYVPRCIYWTLDWSE